MFDTYVYIIDNVPQNKNVKWVVASFAPLLNINNFSSVHMMK